MKFNKMIPELSVTNLAKSLEFYLGLGFKIEYERPENKFIFLSLEGSQLMLQEGVNETESRFHVSDVKYPFGRGLHFQIEVKNINKLIAFLEKNNYPIKSPVSDSWFRKGKELLGMRNVLVQDPDGYLFLFFQDLGAKPC
jgi:catechol 2,3-dioxygenase-like lactoylglutathione lyase family enzyme